MTCALEMVPALCGAGDPESEPDEEDALEETAAAGTIVHVVVVRVRHCRFAKDWAGAGVEVLEIGCLGVDDESAKVIVNEVRWGGSECECCGR